ncbi:MAG: SGNH/GDSL hydrolase family protein [Methylococcales bacterium]|nr:SGNH/GDSL hydrolase family protein [Methylococcales bacterium]
MMKLFFLSAVALFFSTAAVSSDITASCPRLLFELNSCRECLIANPIDEILVIGNSITRHPVSAALGWENAWGMAASRQENDWIHLVAKYIAQDQIKVPELYALHARIAEGIVGKRRLILIQAGDNMIDVTFGHFEKLYREWLDFIAENTSAPVFILSTWMYPSDQKSAHRILKRLAKEYGHAFIDISEISHDVYNLAESEVVCQGSNADLPVCWHPGDAGMKRIAFEVCNQNHASIYDHVKGELVLEDILIGNAHYYMRLKNEGSYSFSIVESKLLPSRWVDSYSAVYDRSSQLIDIPYVYALHNYYHVNLTKGIGLDDRFLLRASRVSPR